jgi:hypothetical protein
MLALCALLLAGCGGRSGPSIDADVAAKLAGQADAIATAKDSCAARTHARILQRQTIAATNAGRIPAAFQEVLLARVNEIASELELRCLPVPAVASTEPAPPPVVRAAPRPRPRPHGHGHGDERHGHGKKKGHDR